MARYENNRTKSYPYGQNFHRNYGYADYETGPWTDNSFPYRADEPAAPRNTDAWSNVDRQRGNRGPRSERLGEQTGYYGDANSFEKPPFNTWNAQQVRGQHFGKGPKGWKRSDERIKEDACEALYHSREVDASNIEVDVKEGVVHLRGHVESREAKRAAEECVEELSGVCDVSNELQIQPHIRMVKGLS